MRSVLLIYSDILQKKEMKERKMQKCFEKVRDRAPRVHNITNYVTVNDVANIVLACGGNPIMSDAPEEVEEVTSVCDSLNLNLGTLHREKLISMLKAGKKAKELEHPVVFDPVGVGASSFRMNAAQQIMEEVRPTLIRGNVSEIRALAWGSRSRSGVDAELQELVTEENLSQMISSVKRFAQECGAIIVMTGAIDLVTDGVQCFVIRNGRTEMSRITGTGCQLSGALAAFLAANPEQKVLAAAAATSMLGTAGEIAWEYLQPYEGNASYRNRIIDAVYHMDGEQLEKRANYEIR